MTEKPQLPNAVAVLVLGICSIAIGCIYGIGLVCGIIGIVLSTKGRQMYKENPEMYSGWGMLNAGFIMSIIGLVWSGFIILMAILGVAMLGSGMLHHSYSY